MQHQSYAYGLNHRDVDPDLRQVLACNWPEYTSHQADSPRFGELPGRDVREVAYHLEVLTVSRLANAIAGIGIARKAHLEVLERVRRRRSFVRPLVDHPPIRRDLTAMAARLAGGLVPGFHAARRFQGAWEDRPPYSPGTTMPASCPS